MTCKCSKCPLYEMENECLCPDKRKSVKNRESWYVDRICSSMKALRKLSVKLGKEACPEHLKIGPGKNFIVVECKGKNPAGARVILHVCSGWILKDTTIRHP